MSKLIHENKTILPEMKHLTSIFELARGLMFASKKRVDKGACLVMLGKTDKKFGVSIHMVFCFMKYDVLFVNSEFKVVDKKTLKPFSLGYTPKEPCKYVIESTQNKFKDIKIGDKIKLEL